MGPGRSTPVRERAELRLAVRMPRHAATVSVVRALVDCLIVELGVVDECRREVALAVSEACNNAVAHAGLGDGYEVTVDAHGGLCVIEVADAGVGLPPVTGRDRPADGRGLSLMRAFSDSVDLRPVHPHGLSVRMTKKLTSRA